MLERMGTQAAQQTGRQAKKGRLTVCPSIRLSVPFSLSLFFLILQSLAIRFRDSEYHSGQFPLFFSHISASRLVAFFSAAIANKHGHRQAHCLEQVLV
mmetsp:Transcript_1849/g.3853  ORF Transcript_1849/g.3853 Transcript_1849/m.3853 type:complete len:98 (+) Transcript_1849:1411-1704(+)